MVRLVPMNIKKIDDIPAPETVDQIADYSRIKKSLGESARLYAPRGPLQKEKIPAAPNEKSHYQYREKRERPDMTLKHAPRAPPILDVRQIEKTGDDGDGFDAALAKIVYRQLFSDCINKQ